MITKWKRMQALVVAMDAIEGLDHGPQRHVETCLLADLALDGIGQRLAQLQ